MKIRFADPKDIHQIIDLCEAHAHYEKASYTSAGKAEQLTKDLFAENPKLYCLVVEKDNRLVGYATYMKQYATWDAAEYIYMDCLFLNENTRGLGMGGKLVQRIQKEGKKLGCNLVQWQTPDFNVGAIQFYNRIGAISISKERFFLDT